MQKKQLRQFIIGLLSVITVFIVILFLSVPYVLLRSPTPIIHGKTLDRVLIENAKVIDLVNDEVDINQFIVIENGVIVSVSNHRPEVMNFDNIIDVNNRFVIPGLTDMHVHIIDRSDLLLNLAHGITQVRNMHGSDLQLALRDEVNNGQSVGPDMWVSSPVINQKSPYASSDFHWYVEDEQEAKQLVRNFFNQGYDLIKVYDGLRPNVFAAITEEATLLGLPVAGHPSFYVEIDHFLSSGAQTLEHVEMLYQAPLDYSKDRVELEKLILSLKKHQTPITPTLVVFDNLVKIAQQKSDYIEALPLEYMHPALLWLIESDMRSITRIEDPDAWALKSDYLGQMTNRIIKHDIPWVLGSDAGAGFTLNGIGTIDEMRLLHKHGISKIDILRSAIIEPNKVLNEGKIKGRVEPGYQANLVFLNDDPRKNFNTFYTVQGVVKGSHYYNESMILAMKKNAEDHMSYYELFGWMLLDQVKRM